MNAPLTRCLLAGVSLSALLAVPTGAEASPPGLVAWWQLDDTSDSAPGGTRPLTLVAGAVLADVDGDGALVLDPDPSDNRAVATAFNPADSFSLVIDFRADTIPAGSVDPQYILLSNVGNDSMRFFGQFGMSPGYMVYVRPNWIGGYQKTSGGFPGAVAAGMGLPDPTGRHTVVVNWEFVGDECRFTLYLDGSGSSVTSGFGPMDFSGGETTNLLLGTNVDEAYQPPRTLDGALFEVAILDGLLTPEQIDVVTTHDVGALVCPPDIDGSGDIGFDDLLRVLSEWGPCVGCREDVDGNGDVGFSDLLAILSEWGSCQ